MISIPRRTQWWSLAIAYTTVALMSAAMLYGRHLMYLRLPAAEAQGGMYAFGDLLQVLFIYFLFFIPTIFLLRMFATYESKYELYAKVVLVLSITAPICLAWVYFASPRMTEILGGVLLLRLVHTPLLFVLFAVSRLWARTKFAKRRFNYALLLEGGTLVLSIAALFLTSRLHS